MKKNIKNMLFYSFLLMIVLQTKAYKVDDQKAYDSLTSVKKVSRYIAWDKTSWLRQLNALEALLIQAGLDRATQLLGPTDEGKKYIATLNNIYTKLNPLIIAGDTQKVKSALEYVLWSFEERVSQDNQRIGLILGGAQTTPKGEPISIEFSKQFKTFTFIKELLEAEFEALNEKYSEVQSAIRKLGGRTILPQTISWDSLMQLAQ